MNKETLFKTYREAYEKMMLYTDVMKTQNDIHYALENTGIKLKLKLYNAAPVCFLAIFDDYLLIEQYHFGQASDERVAE